MQANQAAEGTGRVVKPLPAVTLPAPDTELMNLIQGLQREIRELRATQNSNPAIRNMVEGTASPLAPHLLTEEVVGDLRFPPTLIYDGSSDPVFHLVQYQTTMQIRRQTPAAMCQAFCLTLTGPAFEWYQKLAKGAIGSFEELKERFITRFASSLVQKKEKSYLWSIK